MPVEAFSRFIQCTAPFECSPAFFPSGVSGNRLAYSRDAAVEWQSDHRRKCISFCKMVSRLCLLAMSSLTQQEDLSGLNSLEDQKQVLKFWGLLPSWLLIHHLVQMDRRWKLLQSECYCWRGFCEMSWGIQPSSKWKYVSSAIDTWAVNLSCQQLQWILLHGVLALKKMAPAQTISPEKYTAFTESQFATQNQNFSNKYLYRNCICCNM